ncbi:hypothetical protein [Leisingera sp.]|uniref:hypothetical protein n=1 Tax=Leisingera sp. TaxID=1879318 RepID=UPI002B269F3B|nr:hypothetical protein [Leisingera sp.]
MNIRSSRTAVAFFNAFTLPGYPDSLPAGQYQVVAEEELIQGLSFEAYRRTATYLEIRNRGGQAGRTELRPVSESALKQALRRDRDLRRNSNDSEAEPSPQEDLR